MRPACVLAQVTLVGDLVSMCAAVAGIGYFEMGQRLRAWMPVFLYACPATGGSLCTRRKTLCTCPSATHAAFGSTSD